MEIRPLILPSWMASISGTAERPLPGIEASSTPHTPGRECQLDGSDAVLYAFGVVFDSTRVKNEARRRRSPHLGGLHDHFRRDTGNLRCVFRRVLLYRSGYFIKASRVVCNKFAIDPAALDEDVEHAVEDADIAARTNWNKQVCVACNRRHPRIKNDQLAAVIPRLPQVVGGDRCTFGHIRAGNQDHLRLRYITPRIRAAIDAEDFLRRCTG